VLDRLRVHYLRWQLADGDARRCGLLDAYTARCLTLDRSVWASLPGDVVLEGVGDSIDADGRLVVRLGDGGLRPVSAGDVTVVR
jgi:BirA family biotin operon repressor/biotin-[acetyl-CoA-carboxylase] ligase